MVQALRQIPARELDRKFLTLADILAKCPKSILQPSVLKFGWVQLVGNAAAGFGCFNHAGLQ